MSVNIKYGNSGKLSISINNLVGLGKTFADITGVIFMMKVDSKQKDDDAPFQKIYPGGGITLDQGSEKIIVSIDKADFGPTGLVSKKTYLIAMGTEFNDSGEYFEDKDDKMQRNAYIIEDKVEL